MQQSFSCPDCGSQNAIGQRFCGGCGKKFQYNCPRCGGIIDPAFRFCPDCRTELGWPEQQQAQPLPVGQKIHHQPPSTYGYGRREAQRKETSSSPIGYLGLIGIVLLIGGAIFALQGPDSATETLPEYIQQYENKQPPYVKASGKTIQLDNNPDAKDVSFAELKTFIRNDYTDKKPYLAGIIECGNFAEQLHNNAEQAGIKAAFVGVDFVGEEIGHALNAFKTTDRGLVYIDCTGGRLKLVSFTTIEGEKKSLLLPGQNDKVAYIEKGKEYGAINIDKAESLQYSFYIEYDSNRQRCEDMLEDYNSEVRRYNQAIRSKVYYEGSQELAELEAWEAELERKERRIKELEDKLGSFWFEPLGIVESVEIYW